MNEGYKSLGQRKEQGKRKEIFSLFLLRQEEKYLRFFCFVYQKVYQDGGASTGRNRLSVFKTANK
jgi:hypothetical protein